MTFAILMAGYMIAYSINPAEWEGTGKLMGALLFAPALVYDILMLGKKR